MAQVFWSVCHGYQLTNMCAYTCVNYTVIIVIPGINTGRIEDNFHTGSKMLQHGRLSFLTAGFNPVKLG